MTCIEINPGAKKVIKGTPRTSPLSDPIANDKTNKKSSDEIKGEKMVWLKAILDMVTFPIKYWIARYNDWKEEREYQKKIKAMKKKDPYIYKQKGEWFN